MSGRDTLKPLLLGCLLVFSLPTLAQTGGQYKLRWGTIGSTSTGGSYSLKGTIGGRMPTTPEPANMGWSGPYGLFRFDDFCKIGRAVAYKALRLWYREAIVFLGF